MTSLQSRILTAIILIPLALSLLFFAPLPIVCAASLLLLLGCGWEWLTLIPLQRFSLSLIFIFILLISTCISTLFFPLYQCAGLILWSLIFLCIISFPRSQFYWGKETIVMLSGFILLPLCWTSAAYVFIQESGPAQLLYLLLLVWAADTGAYFVGKKFGKHKLIPAVSPGKTVEGALGGLLTALSISIAGYVYFQSDAGFIWFIQAFATIVFAMIGDLFISMLKRRVKCKDTSQILPGHGGLLDRLDSFIAAAPVFYLLGFH
jgi:phosphatidate cytidylyltransferase